MKTNPGKVYGTKSYTVSTHRIPTSLHDEAVRLGISISDTLAEGLLAKIRARGGSGIEALRIQLLKKKEERELLDQTIKDLEKSIEIEEEKLREAYNARGFLASWMQSWGWFDIQISSCLSASERS